MRRIAGSEFRQQHQAAVDQATERAKRAGPADEFRKSLRPFGELRPQNGLAGVQAGLASIQWSLAQGELSAVRDRIGGLPVAPQGLQRAGMLMPQQGERHYPAGTDDEPSFIQPHLAVATETEGM